MNSTRLLYYLFIGTILCSCKNFSENKEAKDSKAPLKTETLAVRDSVLYSSENLIIQQLSNHVYEHISYLKTQDFGKVACNGMIVINDHKALVFDTPADAEGSIELINYITTELDSKIEAVIPTHFHQDCVGGLEEFFKSDIPAYASDNTIALLKSNGRSFSKPINGFGDSISFDVGNKKVYAQYFGAGHTRDNIIGYFPDENVVFGGCLIKEMDASKGNLEDANVEAWATSVRKLKANYPKAEIVIPGHGKYGGTELFDYTIELFDKDKG